MSKSDKRTTISLTDVQVDRIARLARSMDLDQSKVIRIHLDAMLDISTITTRERLRYKPATNFLLDSLSRLDK